MWGKNLVGSLYVKPDCNQAEHERRVEAHMKCLPPTHLPVVLGADLNSPFGWTIAGSQGLQSVGRCGKSNQFLTQIASRGLELVAPGVNQAETPTSCPRQKDRQGRVIDFIASARVSTRVTTVHVGSHAVIGTDHEVLSTELLLGGLRNRRRPDTRPRVLVSSIPEIQELDQQVLSQLAKEHTAPKKAGGYKDPPSVKSLLSLARFSKRAEDWKRAFAERRKERRKHKEEQVNAVANGDWSGFKKLRSKNTGEWECHFAESQPGDPHKCIHEHLEGIYGHTHPDLSDFDPVGIFHPITPDELHQAVNQGKKGKSIGEDGTSLELLEGVLAADGGESALMSWFNHLLETAEFPEDWFAALMIILPKTARPTQPKQLRPICLLSAVSKVFCRILVNRGKNKMEPIGSTQCAGPGKQAVDYVHAIHRLFCLEREWKFGLAFLKVDLEKAFDCVSKASLMAYIKSRIGESFEARCWQRFLNKSEAHLHTAWGDSTLNLNNGIRQGAVESPLLFTNLTEWTLEETARRFSWSREDPMLRGLKITELMFVDDATLWQTSLPALARRVEQWMVVLRESGLRINLGKCQLYVSPHNRQKGKMTVNGYEMLGDSHLNIMGLNFAVQQTTCDLLSPLVARARDKFWGSFHLLGSRASLHGRIKMLERVCGGSGLWCVAAFFPEKTAQHMMNSFHLQLLVYMMKIKRGPDEDWLTHRKRVYRAAREVLWRGGHKRWSTLWAERFWSYQGHVARGVNNSPPLASSLLSYYRDNTWWKAEQQNPRGERHEGKFFARRTIEENDMDAVAGTSWRQAAQSREAWRGLCPAWIRRIDVRLGETNCVLRDI